MHLVLIQSMLCEVIVEEKMKLSDIFWTKEMRIDFGFFLLPVISREFLV